MEQIRQKMNINTASAEDLEELPSIGPALSKAIVQLRERVGRFSSVEDLLPVRGIGSWQMAKIRDLVTVEEEVEVGDGRRESAPQPDQPKVRLDEVALPEELSLPGAEEPVSEGAIAATPFSRVEPVVTAETRGLEEPVVEVELPTPADGGTAESHISLPPEPPVIRPIEPPPKAGAATVDEAPAVKPGAAPTAETVRPATAPAEDYRLQPPLVVERRGKMSFWQWLAAVLLGTVLGAALALGALWALNGTLDFGQHWRTRELQAQVVQMRASDESLDRQVGDANASIEALRQDLTALPQIKSDIQGITKNLSGATETMRGLQSDLVAAQGALDVVTEDLTTLTGAHAALETRVAGLAETLQATATEVQRLSDEMEAVTEKAARFDAFLSGLAQLLAETAPVTTK